jgi:hypothetical protein
MHMTTYPGLLVYEALSVRLLVYEALRCITDRLLCNFVCVYVHIYSHPICTDI